MCTSTRTLISAVSIWPGSTWLTLWPETAHDDEGVRIISAGPEDSEEEAGQTTCTRGPCYNSQWDLSIEISQCLWV